MEDLAESFRKQHWFQELCREHPTRAALLFAILTRTLSSVARWRESVALSGTIPESDKAVWDQEMADLKEYLFEPGVLNSKASMREEVEGSTRFFLDRGMTVPEVMKHVEDIKAVWSQSRRGRPSDRKTLAVRAFDMTLTNPELTWNAISEQICPCTKGYHDDYCREAIRQEVNELKKVLMKYNIKIPSRD